MLEVVRDCWSRRALVLALARRALVARYRGTALGWVWSWLHPLALLLAHGLAFGVVARLDVPDYGAFLAAGLLPWTWLAQGVAIGTTSILGDAPFVRQAAFPPAISPVVTTLATGAHFALGLPVLLAALWALGAPPSPALALLPLAFALQGALVLGLALATSALCACYRDVAQLVPAVLPIVFLATPIAYPAALVPAPWAALPALNPLGHLAEAWRAALTGAPLAAASVLAAAGAAAAALAVGLALQAALRDRVVAEL